MATVAEEIADKLATLGLGTVGTDIFIGVIPERPDAVTAVFETGGEPPEFGFGTPGLKYETPSVQIICRGARGDYATPRARIQLAYLGLPQVQGTTLGSTYYHMIKPIQTPFELRRDDDARVLMVVNVKCEKEMSS
jgi:hypothetical protein